MKKFTLVLAVFVCLKTVHAQVENPGDATKNAATNATNSNIDNGANSAVNKVESGIKGLFKKKKNNDSNNQQPQTNNQNSQANVDNNSSTNNSTAATPTIKTYQNYDFVPGDTILFEDHFTDDQDGEFPSHWDLEKGQAVLNKIN